MMAGVSLFKKGRTRLPCGAKAPEGVGSFLSEAKNLALEVPLSK